MRGGTAGQSRDLVLHTGLIAALVLAGLVLPEYHHGNVARIMVLAVFAMGYNLAFGYTGLLSLGHAMFFAAGCYMLGLGITQLGMSPELALIAAPLAGALLGLFVGALALRTEGPAFMIVTLMFSQAGYLFTSYFGEFTRADEGFVIDGAARQIAGFDLTNPDIRYWAALLLFALTVVVSWILVRSRLGRAMVAVRENEPRARMLGYDTYRVRLIALTISGAIAGAAGGAYALFFGYVGASFASIQYSIFPLLWVLLGGAGTILGPFVGSLTMFYLIDITSSLSDAYLIVVGVVLVILVLFLPTGVMGSLRKRWMPWLS